MPVVIEELQADVNEPTPLPPEPRPAGSESVSDERELLETMALETWALRRLMAD